jgi:hyperosmotically inducible protein
MNNKLATSCLIIGTLLVPALAYADDRDSDRSHPVTYVKDSVITTKVKAMLADEKMRSLAHVQVDTDDKGRVVLSGNVRSRHDADKAVAIANGIDGVTSVRSELLIKKDD